MKECKDWKKHTLPNPVVYRNEARPKSLRWRCKTKTERISKSRTEPILEQPVGVAFGTLNIKDFLDSQLSAETPNDVEGQIQALLIQGYATCLVAFGETYITPEDEWTIHTLNRILCEGKNHLQNSSKSFEGKLQQVESIPKCFSLCGNAMEVMISLPILIGRIECPNSRVYSLGVGLSMFMSKYKHALLRTEDRFYLIWKKSKVYFLFDCYGRAVDLHHVDENGNVALLCVSTIKGIDTLMSYMGGISGQSAYTLYEIRMKRFMPCCDKPIICTGSGRKADFEVISNDHAKLAGVCHIGSDCFGESRYKQALAVGLISIIYSKIDAPCTWDSNIIDKIIIMGDQRYKEWTEFNPEKCLTIEDIPERFRMGQFCVCIAFFPEQTCGNWSPRVDQPTQDISRSIREIFEKKKVSGVLVQLNDKVFAMFLRHGFYYLFDPYPPNILKATKYGGHKNATLHMFNNLNLLCCIFTQEILNLYLPCNFVIHVVKIIELLKPNNSSLPIKTPLLCSSVEIDWNLSEIESLCESIYDTHCETIRKCVAEEFDIGVCDLDVPPFTEFQNGSDVQQSVLSFASDSGDFEEEDEDVDVESEEKALEEEDDLEDEEDEKQTDDDSMGDRQSSRRNKSSNPDRSKPSNMPEDKNDRNSKKRKTQKIERVSKNRGKRKDHEDDADTDETDNQSAESGIGNRNKSKTRRKIREKKGKNKLRENREKTDKSEIDKDKNKGKAKGKGKERYKEGTKKGKGKDKKAKGQKSKGRKNKHSNELSEDSEISDTSLSANKKRTDNERNKSNQNDKSNSQPAADKDRERKSDSSLLSTKTSTSDTHLSKKTSKSILKPSKSSEATKPDEIQPNRVHSECIPNSYPGYTHVPQNLAVVGSESGTYQSLCQLVRTGFQAADRTLTMTPWGNYVIFQSPKGNFFLYSGCTCNPCRFRNMDLSIGTAGLLYFGNLHDLIIAIMKGRNQSRPEKEKILTADEICEQYC